MFMKYRKIAVLYGGISDERFVSLRSGKDVLNVLSTLDIKIYSYDMKYFSLKKFLKNKYDNVLILLHGEGGEDGSVQSLLDLHNIRYVSSGVLSSYITFNKFKTKFILNNFNINVVPSFFLNISVFRKYYFLDYLYKFFCKSIIFNLGLPLIIKPNYGGSSIGILIINNFYDLYFNLKKYIYEYKSILIEKYIFGKEYTVSILNNKILPSILIKKENLYYDFKSKYECGFLNYVCPSRLSKYLDIYLSNLSMKIWKILGCKNIGRIDFIMDKYNNFWFLEINTIPGMTNYSLLPYAASKVGIDFVSLVKNIIYI